MPTVPCPFLVILLIAGASTACSPPAADGSGTDAASLDEAQVEREVVEAMNRYAERVGDRDLKGVLASFADEADVVVLGSKETTVAVGAHEVRAFFENILSRPETFAWEWDRRVVGASGDVAWVFAQGQVVIQGPGGVVRAPYRMTGVLQRRGNGWMWLQYHGSEPAAD